MDAAYRIARNSAVMIASEILNKALALILTIALARYLGDYGFGQYSFVITLMMIFQVLADFGLDGLTIREIAKNKANTRLYLGNVLALKLLLGAISLLLLFVVVNLMRKPVEMIYGAYIASIAVIVYSIANTFAAIFNAHERLDSRAYLILLGRFAVIAVSFAAILLKKGLILLIIAILAGEIVRAVAGWLICRNKYAEVDFRIDPSLCKKLLIAAMPFGVIGMISLIYFKIDIVMLSLMKDDRVVGWYSAAYSLLAALLFITEAYNLSIFPALSRYADSAKNLLAFGWERSVKYLLIISLPISVGTTILAHKIVILFYSKSYEPSVIALQILIWTLPWIFVNSINMRVLYATDRQKEAAAVAFASMVLNVAFNLILIPRYSYIGSSFATMAVEVANVSAYFWLVSRLLGMKVKVSGILPKPLVAAAAMGGVMYFFDRLSLISLLAIGAVSYFAALLLLGTFDGEDKRIFRKIIPFLRKEGS